MTARWLAMCCVALAATSPVAAQSSQFGIRGLGHPGRWTSARALGVGGSVGLFDGTSSQNPAALALLTTVTSMFTSSTSWREVENPAGSASLRSTRFPQILVGGRVGRTPLALSFSYSTYADRDFTTASSGTLSPRGIPVAFTDTLTSRGGISDLRLAGGWQLTPRIAVGAGVHFLTGSNRLNTRRVFEDSLFIPALQRAELAYQAIGVSAGVLVTPTAGLSLAGAVRKDGALSIERDSAAAGDVDLPLTLMGGARFRVRSRIDLSAQVSHRGWDVADSGLRANGAVGARSTIDVSGGIELINDPRRPGDRPIRIGVRYATLPFLLADTDQPSEWGVSIGSGLRFRPGTDSRDVGGIDVALERIQRSQGSNYSESAWILSVGLSIFTGGTP